MMIGKKLRDDVDTMGRDITRRDEQIEQYRQGVVRLAFVTKTVESNQTNFAVRGDIW